MDIVRVFGANVRHFRQQRGLSQEKLAELSDLHRTYISDLERAQRSISLSNVQRLADALGVKPFMLLLEDKEEKDAR